MNFMTLKINNKEIAKKYEELFFASRKALVSLILFILGATIFSSIIY